MKMTRARAITVAVALFVVLAGTLTGVLLGARPSSAAADPNVAQESQIAQQLKAVGLHVSAVQIQDKTMSVTFSTTPLTEENAISNVLKIDTIKVLAGNAGMTMLDLKQDVGGQVENLQRGISFSPVTHAAADQTEQAIRDWMAQIESKTGVSATETTEDGRTDLALVGSVDGLQSAVEDFMTGGFALHGQGDLDLLTLVAKTDTGQTVFEGVGSYLTMTLYKPFIASGFMTDW